MNYLGLVMTGIEKEQNVSSQEGLKFEASGHPRTWNE